MSGSLKQQLASYGEVALNDELLRVLKSGEGHDLYFQELRRPNFCNIGRLDCCGNWSRRLIEVIPEIKEVEIAKVLSTGLQTQYEFIAHESVLVNQEWVLDGTWQQVSSLNRGKSRLPNRQNNAPRILIFRVGQRIDNILKNPGIPLSMKPLWKADAVSQRKINGNESPDKVPLRPDYVRSGFKEKY